MYLITCQSVRTLLGEMYSIINGDALEVLKRLPSESIQCCVTSPPYFGLRDYNVSGQIGLEQSVDDYIQKLILVFSEVYRVLKIDGTLWLNIGDSYNGTGQKNKVNNTVIQLNNRGAHRLPAKNAIGFKSKELMGIPWRTVFALQKINWILRQDIIWSKPNPMPESVKDRCTRAHEYIFLLSKSRFYFFNSDAIKEPAVSAKEAKWAGNKSLKSGQSYAGSGQSTRRFSENWEFRNKRSVWSVSAQPYFGAHFAVFPEKLIEPCILAGSKPNDFILDPFCGSGTTGKVAIRNDRNFIGIELNPDFQLLAAKRVNE